MFNAYYQNSIDNFSCCVWSREHSLAVWSFSRQVEICHDFSVEELPWELETYMDSRHQALVFVDCLESQ